MLMEGLGTEGVGTIGIGNFEADNTDGGKILTENLDQYTLFIDRKDFEYQSILT